ncbi:hypothetical protein [Actinoplanes couchii]|nr:hypothetical protein [Actinoplanes couchii]MDR6321890.1 hypothetical protein [Actinoplanes couchii]
MRIGVIAVHPGPTTVVDALVAGVPLKAAWAGSSPPAAGRVVDVELDIDAVLEWDSTIAVEDGAAMLRPGPLLRGTVEQQEEGVLTLRVAEGLVQVEVAGGSVDAPAGTAVAVVAEHVRLYPTNT